MRPIISLLAILLTTSVVDAAPSKPSVADQIRHPRGQQVDRAATDLQYALLLRSRPLEATASPKARTRFGRVIFSDVQEFHAKSSTVVLPPSLKSNTPAASPAPAQPAAWSARRRSPGPACCGSPP
jgi:hypothetical protein